MASDDDGASSGRLVLDDLVSRDDTLLLVGGAKLVGEIILSNTSEVGGRALGKNVLESGTAVQQKAQRKAREARLT